MAFVKKKTSPKNREGHTVYGYKHCPKPVEDFFSNIIFTDEAHVDPSSQTVGDILGGQGTRYDPENIQEKGQKKGVKFHIAAWISWYGKAENGISTVHPMMAQPYCLQPGN
jgi:hypothetical protein